MGFSSSSFVCFGLVCFCLLWFNRMARALSPALLTNLGVARELPPIFAHRGHLHRASTRYFAPFLRRSSRALSRHICPPIRKNSLSRPAAPRLAPRLNQPNSSGEHAPNILTPLARIFMFFIRCRKHLILARVKFPFSPISRFGFLNSLLPVFPVLAF